MVFADELQTIRKVTSSGLDLLLLTVAKSREVHPDGLRFQGFHYVDPALAAYEGEYFPDGRDITMEGISINGL